MRGRALQLKTVGFVVLVAFAGASAPAYAQTAAGEYKPQVGQPGKDAVWVPTSMAVVNRMLDMGKVTPNDFVIDLGSGDGRNVIAAAKRGARGLGVEWNNDLVELSKRIAAKEGVADKASFIQGDMYAADISKGTLFVLFLLTENLDKLMPKFLDLKPGTRIVANTFGISGWTPDEKEEVRDDCTNWCTSLMWIVPAKVQGTWRLADGDLALKQEFQMVSGTLGAASIANGRLRGDQIKFSVDGAEYEGKVSGATMEGTVTKGGTKGKWSATRK
jgi:hypothetical protein